ncbi:MAG TPA: ornithine cyclodeaminase family protein [Ktedonobacteraceae bacterium]|nr:ornithine cyclodeaminase family protein [Ktedonobacteraceae bacterium]
MRSESEDTLLYLCEQEVRKVCTDINSVEIMREAFRLHATGATLLPDEAYLGWENSEGEKVRSLNMPAYLGGTFQIAGTKIINGNIANPRRALPRANGLTILYDDISVRPCCILEGAYLSSLRTASVTALATDLLLGQDVEDVALIGAGVLAQAHIELLLKYFPRIRTIRMFDLDQERITRLQSMLSRTLQQHSVAFLPTKTAEDAIRPARLIVPVTTTTTGYIHYSWLRPGALLVNVSLDDALPSVVFQADSIVVDDWSLVRNDSRRLIGRMYREGKILGPGEPGDVVQGDRRRIDAELGEIVVGKKVGRISPEDIILFNPFGLAIEDIALASQVYRLAQKDGLGMHLPR